MLPKKNRFSFKKRLPKQTFASHSFSLRYSENDEGLKVAVVVSKKVDTRAVKRNQIKREIVSAIEKNISKDVNLSLIFYVKKEAMSNELSQEVSQALQKINESNWSI